MKIERATLADTPWLAGQMRAFSSALNTKHSYIFPTDEPLHQELQHMVESHVVLVAWQDSTPVGAIGGLAGPHPFNPEVSALVERFWWVIPDKRGSKAGYLLLRAFMKIGERYDTTVVSLENDSNVSDRMMARFGLKQYERTYAREI